MKNKRRGRIIVTGIVIMSFLVLSSIGYCLFQSIKITGLHDKVLFASEIDSLITNFEKENFIVHSKISEYINDPSQERMDALIQQKEKVDNLLNRFIIIANSENSSFYNGAIEDINEIEDNFFILDSGLEEIFSAANEYQIAKANNISNEELLKLGINLHSMSVGNEYLFGYDELEKSIENFTQKQQEKVAKYVDNIGTAHDNLNITLLFLTGEYLVLLILITIWLKSLIDKGKK